MVNRAAEIVCVGETMAQVVPIDGRSVVDAEAFSISAAGAESNVAQGLAQLGTSVAWVSRLGRDALGRRILDDLARAGVDTAHVRLEDGARTGLFVKDPRAVGSTVTYYRESSAASNLSKDDVFVALGLAPKILHMSGITPALSETCRESVRHALDETRRLGITSSFDVNYRASLWSSREIAAAETAELANHADIVFVGLDEAHALWGTDTVDDVHEILGGPRVLVVKDGARRAVTLTSDGPPVSEPALKIDVVEPVGAGDAFAAGWLHGALQDWSHQHRLRLGHAMARAALTSISDHFELNASPSELLALTAGDNDAEPAATEMS